MQYAVCHVRAELPSGAGVPNPTVGVVNSDTGFVPQLFLDRGGLVPLSNPFTADAPDGYVEFFVAGGAYDVTLSSGTWSKTFHAIAVGTAAEHDSDEHAVNVKTVATNYTLTSEDAGWTIEGDSPVDPITITVPPNADDPMLINTGFTIVQVGAAQVTIVEGAGVTINSRVGKKLAGQYAMAAMYQRAEDEWVLGGDLTP